MATKTVVITGFEPWGHAAENPTLDILDRLRGKNFEGIELKTVRMPVDTTKIGGLVSDALDEHHPDVWFSLGLYPGSSLVSIERTAANVRDFPVGDNAGNQPYDEPVFEGAPPAYWTNLPLKAIVRDIRKRGIPVKVSNSASTYLCNQIMYSALHLSKEKRLKTRAGFIHVPCTPQYVARAPYPEHEWPSMSLDLMIEAVETAVTTATTCERDIKEAPKGY